MKKKIKSKLIIILSIVLLLLGGTYVGLNIYIDSLLGKIEHEETINEEDIEINVELSKEADEVVNFLLVGADNLQREIGRENSWVESRSDVQKIISLDYTTKKVKITSLDRDVIEYFPGEDYNEFYRFNWAYSFGKRELCMSTINYNLDLDVTKYVTMSFAGFINVIDTLGGIDVELTQAEADAFNGIGSSNAVMNIQAVAGINHLDGYNALKYSQQRYVDSDFQRMNRQTFVIKKVVEKLKDCSYTEIINVINEILPYINTNLTNDEIKKYVKDALTFDLTNIETYTYPKAGTSDLYWNYTTDMGGYVLNDYVEEVIELHKFIYEVEEYTPTEEVQKMNEEVHEQFPFVKEGKPSGV